MAAEVPVFYDVTASTVEILAVIDKAETQAWLDRSGTPDPERGSRRAVHARPRLNARSVPTAIESMLPTIATVALVLTSSAGTQAPASPEVQEILRLEGAWNQAHLRGDVPVLDALCATDLVVTVPGMKRMTKADILGFWQSGRAQITRYDTSDVRVVVRGNTAVATGQLARTRNFNGKILNDVWQFTKTYSNEGGRWVLVAYHASDAPQ